MNQTLTRTINLRDGDVVKHRRSQCKVVTTYKMKGDVMEFGVELLNLNTKRTFTIYCRYDREWEVL